jgi:hypothetical protein
VSGQGLPSTVNAMPIRMPISERSSAKLAIIGETSAMTGTNVIKLIVIVLTRLARTNHSHIPAR